MTGRAPGIMGRVRQGATGAPLPSPQHPQSLRSCHLVRQSATGDLSRAPLNAAGDGALAPAESPVVEIMK